MAHIENRNIHPDVRPAGRVLRRIMPSFTREQLMKLSEKCEKYLAGRWLGKNTRVEQRMLERPDGTQLRVLICRSKAGTKPEATGLLWIHGGGYAIGAPEQDFFFTDPLVRDGSCVAVMPAYTLATKAPYPAALEDCYLALRWMKENAQELGINPGQLFVGGDSAGGGLTAAVCLYARDRGEVNIAFQMPLYPMLDDRDTESSKDNHAPVWNTKRNHAAWKLYLGSVSEEVSPYAAPARQTDYSGLPPAYTFVGGIEPFYCETLTYMENLRKAGIEAHVDVYPKCFHAFDLYLLGSKVRRQAIANFEQHYQYAAQHYTVPQKDK